MKILIDSSDQTEAASWLDVGVGHGVTTNPILLSAQGLTVDSDELRNFVRYVEPRPISVQLDIEDENLAKQRATEISALGSNVVVKIPVSRADGSSTLPLIADVASAGISVNATACLSAGQAIFAAEAGASYVSLLFGRIADEGGQATAAVRTTRLWLDDASLDSKIIAASIRSPGDFYGALEALPHFITIAPAVLRKIGHHHFSAATVREMLAAAGR